MDAEIQAMLNVNEAFEELGEEARTRVLRWAWERFAPANSAAPTDPLAKIEPPLHKLNGESGSSFEHFGDLFHTFEPKNEPEKALVAAYWIAKHVNQDTFQSAGLNKELTNLGHKIVNITDALDSLIRKKPSLIIQTKKSGSSRQARKTYKISQAGVQEVDNRLA